MTQQNPKQRRMLIVTSVGRKNEPSAGNPVISFSAHIEGDENQKGGYETWGTELVPLIVVEACLDCEVSFVPKGQDIVQRVTQIFDRHGNPVRQPQRRPGGGYSGGKSDSQVALEITSSEGQSAYNGIIELIKTNTIELTHEQAKTALEYAEKKMKDGMQPFPAPTQPGLKPAARTESRTAAPPAEDKQNPRDKVTKSKRDPTTILSTNDLLKACNKDFHLQPSDVYTELNVTSKEQLTKSPSEYYRIIAAVRG